MWTIIAFTVVGLFLLCSFILNIVLCFVIWKGYNKIVEQESQIYHIKNGIQQIIEACLQTTIIFENDLVKTIGADSVPQYKQLSSALKHFEITLQAAIEAFSEMKTHIEENENG